MEKHRGLLVLCLALAFLWLIGPSNKGIDKVVRLPAVPVAHGAEPAYEHGFSTDSPQVVLDGIVEAVPAEWSGAFGAAA